MSQEVKPDGQLCVMWTTSDREVALKMVFMYTLNSKLKEWWGRVRLIVWGPSAKLLTEDEELQEHIADMQAAGVEVHACKRCAELYDVVDELAGLGIKVYYIGVEYTKLLKDDEWTIITY